MHDLALELAELGHDITVLTAGENQRKDCIVEQVEGITVLRIRSGKREGVSLAIRAWNELLLSYHFWRRGKEEIIRRGCDLVVWYSPSIFFSGLIKKLKTHYRIPSYLILRDIFPQWAVDTGVMKKGPVFSFFRMKELQQYRQADIIAVQSPANLEYFNERGWNQKYKLEVLFNWTKPLEQNVLSSDYRRKFGLENKVVFFMVAGLVLHRTLTILSDLPSECKRIPMPIFYW